MFLSLPTDHRQAAVSTDIKIDQEEFEELWVEKAEKVAAKKKVRSARGGRGSRRGGGGTGGGSGGASGLGG